MNPRSAGQYVVVWGPRAASFADPAVALEWLVMRMFEWRNADGDEEAFVYAIVHGVEDDLRASGSTWRHGDGEVRSSLNGSDVVRAYERRGDTIYEDLHEHGSREVGT